MQNYSPGGVATHVYNLIKHMEAYEFVIYAKQGKWQKIYKELDNVKYVKTGWPALSKVKKEGVHIAHFHAIRPLLVSLLKNMLNLKKKEIPIVVTLHGLPIRKFKIKKGLFWKMAYRLKRAYEGWAVRKADVVICVSESDRQFAIDEFKITPEKIRLVYYGIPLKDKSTIVSNDKLKLRERFHIGEEDFVFIIPARFHEQKGLDTLAKALLCLETWLVERKIKFVFLGDGPMFKEIYNQIGGLPFVKMEGVVPHEKMPEWWSIADGMILPSRWEGLPISLIEAGLFKVVPIASDIPGNNEIVIHNKTGLLFEMDNVNQLVERIKSAILHPETMRQLANNLHALVIERHSIDVMITKIKEIYEKLALNSID